MTPLAPLLAFGFANAAMLGWLAAAAAPILIHLWMKRVRRETPWAAVRFLRAAIKRNANRLRLHEWLLLAIRTAIILCVVLAASKPLLDSLGGLVGAGVQTHRVLVLDASLSMRLATEDGTLLDGAKRLARELVERASSRDQHSVCVMAGAQPAAPIASPTIDKAAVLRAVAAVEPTGASTDLGATLTMVGRLLESAEARAQGAQRREVLFFTDLTQTAWAPLAGDSGGSADQSPAAAPLAAVMDKARISLIDVGDDLPANDAATSIRVASGTPTTQETARIVGSLRRFGGEPGSVDVELLIDGLAVESQGVRLSPGVEATVDFRYRFDRPGWRRVELRLPGDRLPADDTRRLAVRVKRRVRVLCVEGGPGAGRYIDRALNPADNAGAALAVRTISDSQLDATVFDGIDAVVLCNVAELSRREAARLGRYARSGGGVVMFLGDRVRPDRYNTELGPAGGGRAAAARPRVRLVASGPADASPPPSPLLPVTIGPAEAVDAFGLDPLGYRHPIVRPFRGRERAGLLTTPVERRWSLAFAEAGAAESVLATADGAPLVVASAVGSGRVVVVGTAGSLASVDPATGRPWTAMPAWPSFVPIVRETIRWVTGAATDSPPPLVGRPIGGRLARSLASAEIGRPGGDTEPIVADRKSATWRYDRTDEVGYYTTPAGSVGGEGPASVVAVNPLPAESDPRRLPPDALPDGIRVRRVALDRSAPGGQLPEPVGLHRGLLLAALGLAAAETLLACWFGREAA